MIFKILQFNWRSINILKLLKDLRQQNYGQSLLELVVAIGIINVGLFSVWHLSFSNFNAEREAQDRVIATNLAREGIEIIKNIRDSNWLAADENNACPHNVTPDNPCQWDSGLTGEDSTAIILKAFSETENVYLDFGPDFLVDPSDARTLLYRDINGFFSHDNGFSTGYRRLITLREVCCEDGSPQDLKCDNHNFTLMPADDRCVNFGRLKIGIDVQSKVGWLLEGEERTIILEDQLYNWR